MKSKKKKSLIEIKQNINNDRSNVNQNKIN